MGSFSPGFRLSMLDVGVLIVGVIATVFFSLTTPSIGFVIGFVVGHFFLFCNVIRMARPLELVWAAVFTTLSAMTLIANVPGWVATAVLSSITTIVVVGLEMRKPSYHGIAWQRINPELKEWWDARQSAPIDAEFT